VDVVDDRHDDLPEAEALDEVQAQGIGFLAGREELGPGVLVQVFEFDERVAEPEGRARIDAERLGYLLETEAVMSGLDQAEFP